MKLDTIVSKCSYVFCMMLFFVLLNGFGDYRISLPNGFSLNTGSGTGDIIAAPNHSVILCYVTKYGIYGNFVVGYAEMPDGYFVLNTDKSNLRSDEEAAAASVKAGAISMNEFYLRDFPRALDKQTWLDVLRKNGIADEPKLSIPSWYVNHPLLKYFLYGFIAIIAFSIIKVIVTKRKQNPAIKNIS